MLEATGIYRVAVNDWLSCESEDAGSDGSDIPGEVEGVSDVSGF